MSDAAPRLASASGLMVTDAPAAGYDFGCVSTTEISIIVTDHR